jgi:hypothetical protein
MVDDNDKDRDFLLQTARKCRELADQATTAAERARWLAMAESFFARARELE